MKLGEELARRPQPLAERAAGDRSRCEATCKPTKFMADRNMAGRCSFAAVDELNGKRLCGTHIRLAKRTEPAFAAVVAFVMRERDECTPLWKSILAAMKGPG